MGWREWWRNWMGPEGPGSRTSAGPRPPVGSARPPSVPSSDGEPAGRSSVKFIRLDGALDSTTAAELERQLQGYIEDGEIDLVVDFSGVPYVSSRGWGTLVSVLQALRKLGGDIRVAGMCPGVLKLFYQTGLSSIFEVFAGPAEKNIPED
jgi:anti-anti-sigma factor